MEKMTYSTKDNLCSNNNFKQKDSKNNAKQWFCKIFMLCVLTVVSALPTLAQTPLNETEVYNRIMSRQYEEGYKEGTPWTNSTLYINTVEYFGYPAGCYTMGGCAAFMLDMMEFASNYEYPIRKINASYDNIPKLHIGDGLRVNGGGHSVLVIGISDNGHEVTVAEGNFNSSVHWGRKIDLSQQNEGLVYVATFWPEEKDKKGDVDHDGDISLADILLTVDYILNKNPDGFFKSEADLDGDNEVSLADILSIVNIILEKES